MKYELSVIENINVQIGEMPLEYQESETFIISTEGAVAALSAFPERLKVVREFPENEKERIELMRHKNKKEKI